MGLYISSIHHHKHSIPCQRGVAKCIIKGSEDFSFSRRLSMVHILILVACPSIVTRSTLKPHSCVPLMHSPAELSDSLVSMSEWWRGNGSIPVAKGYSGLVSAVHKLDIVCMWGWYCTCLLIWHPTSDTPHHILLDLPDFFIVACLKVRYLLPAFCWQSTTTNNTLFVKVGDGDSKVPYISSVAMQVQY